eukprot:1761982-Rhodomonas_salina.1
MDRYPQDADEGGIFTGTGEREGERRHEDGEMGKGLGLGEGPRTRRETGSGGILVTEAAVCRRAGGGAQ